MKPDLACLCLFGGYDVLQTKSRVPVLRQQMTACQFGLGLIFKYADNQIAHDLLLSIK
jgi:hypothetical protein